MGIFNITVKVDSVDTVPVQLYANLEHRLNSLQNAHYKQATRADAAEAKITSLLRELANSPLKGDFIEYLQDKYELVIKKEDL